MSEHNTFRAFHVASVLCLCASFTGAHATAQGVGGLLLNQATALDKLGKDLDAPLELTDPTDDEEGEDGPRLLTDEELRLRPPGEAEPDLNMTLWDLPDVPRVPPPPPRDPIFGLTDPPGPQPLEPTSPFPDKFYVDLGDGYYMSPKPKIKWPPRGTVFFGYGTPATPGPFDSTSPPNRTDGIPTLE